MKTNDKRVMVELLIAGVEAARSHVDVGTTARAVSWATTLAVLECLQREGFVTVEQPGMLTL